MAAQLFTNDRPPARSVSAGAQDTPGRRRSRAPSDAIEACGAFHANPARITRARASLVPAPAAAALAETFRLLGDPTRVRLLDALATGELCVCDLATLLGHTVSAVSHQLRLLRGLRLVRARRTGRMAYYSLDDHHIHDLISQARRHVEETAPRGARERAGRREAARA